MLIVSDWDAYFVPAAQWQVQSGDVIFFKFNLGKGKWASAGQRPAALP